MADDIPLIVDLLLADEQCPYCRCIVEDGGQALSIWPVSASTQFIVHPECHWPFVAVCLLVGLNVWKPGTDADWEKVA